MGDVLSFIEKAEQSVDEDEAKELEPKLRKNQFTLDDFLDQLKKIRKMGPLTSLLGMIPGLAGHQLSKMQVDEKEFDRIEAIILSMTPRGAPPAGIDQGLAAPADRQGLGHDRPAGQPAGQAVRRDAQDDARAPVGQDARPRALMRQRCRSAILPRRMAVSNATDPRRREEGPGVARRRRRSRARRATDASSRRSAATTRRPTRRRSCSTRSASATGSPRRPAVEHGQEAPAHPGHLPLSAMPRELLEYLAKALVDKPEAVEVEEFDEDDGTLVLELSVDDDDYGHVIGRGGRTAQALRTVVKAAAVRTTAASSSTSSTEIEVGGSAGPHGLDGSFHVTRPAELLARREVCVDGSLGVRSTRWRAPRQKPIVRLEGVLVARGGRGAARRAAVGAARTIGRSRRGSSGRATSSAAASSTAIGEVGVVARMVAPALLRGARGHQPASPAAQAGPADPAGAATRSGRSTSRRGGSTSTWGSWASER